MHVWCTVQYGSLLGMVAVSSRTVVIVDDGLVAENRRFANPPLWKHIKSSKPSQMPLNIVSE